MKKKFKKLLVMLLVMLCVSVSGEGLFAPVQVEAASAKLSCKTKSIKEKQSFNLQLKNYTGKTKLKWTVSNKKVVAIKKISNTKYKVTGKKSGKATVTVKAGKKSYKCVVTVKKPSKRILTVDKSMLSIKDKGKLVFTLNAAGSLNYYIADTSIISCDWSGSWKNNKTTLYVTGKKNGTTTIKITNTANNENLIIQVSVTGADPIKNSYEKLGEYITKNGTINSDGDKEIRTDVGNSAYVFSYSPNGNKFVFGFDLTDFSIRTVVFADHYDQARTTIIMSGSSPSQATLMFNPTTHTSSATKYFNITPAITYAALERIIQKNYTTYLNTSITASNLTTLKGSGITMKDLGFKYF